MPRTRKSTMDRTMAIQELAKRTAKFLANDEDVEVVRSLEAFEEEVKRNFPKDFKAMDRIATNLALGHTGRSSSD